MHRRPGGVVVGHLVVKKGLWGGREVDAGSRGLLGTVFDILGATTLCLWEGREGGRMLDGEGDTELEVRTGRGRETGEN